MGAMAQVSETNGVVRIEAEISTNRISRAIGGISFSWTNDTATPGFSGTGYIEATASDTNATTTVSSSWQTTSPQVDYNVTFSNAGTYYVWVRGYAGDASSAGVYIGLSGTSPSASRIDLQQYNSWAWANTAAGSSTPVSITIPSAGTYTLNLWMRDSWVDIDRILLTRNPNFSPVANASFWRNQNIYQIITDRFYNGDTSNDGALPNLGPSNGGQAHGGDFKGIEKKLDYIQSLGATAIWISPILKNANGDYHGYAATDFYAVNPRMGSLADLQSLVREAQKRGILVICDVVVNHGSTWVDSADAGWANFVYPPSGYNLKYNSGGQQYAAPFDNASLQAQFASTNLVNIFHNNGGTQNWSDATQVELGELVSLDDFKTESAYVRQKMKEIWTYWINTVGFDAYRIDTVKHVEMGFWDTWSPAIRAAAQAADKPNFFQFGEVFDGSDSKCGSYTGAKTSGIYKMESVLDYPLYYQVGSVFATATGATGAIESRYSNLTTANYDATSLDSLVLNLDNHDNPRFLAATGSTTARLELALVFMYTTRGIPSLYYGTEQDFNGGTDPNNREDMFDGSFEQGPSLGDNFSMTHPRFQLVAKLNNFRRLYPALRTGTHSMLWANFSGPGLLAYARRLGGEEVYVVMNTSTSAQSIGARPTIHPAGTVLVNLFNPAETVTVVAGTDGIPAMSIPASSYKAFVSQAQYQSRPLQPVVSSITPNHDSTGVSVASSLSVTFSQAMNTNNVQSAFSTTPATTGTFSWASGNTVMTYAPSSNMAGNTLYNVRIESTATDTNGLTMQGAFESRFTTGAASSLARPSINSASSANIAQNTATLNATVTANGAATSVWFEYGTTASFGATTATQSIGSGSSPVAVTANLTGLQAGTTYYFRTVASNSQGTTTGNTLNFTTSALLPVVTTTAASYVTAYTASLNGDVTPNGLATSVYFEWGDRSELLSLSNTPSAIGSGTNLVANWASIGSLSPDSTYFFRIVGLNVSGSATNKTYGATLSFKTLPVKPTVTTLGIANATTTAVTLQGAVNPNGNPTSFYFEYGPSPSYGFLTPAQDAGSGSNSVSLSSVLTGLNNAQTYYYRAVASNSYGVSYGTDQSFITGYPPPATTTLQPTSLTTSSAQLRGSVNPNNSYASSWFEWGTTTNYSSTSRAIATDSMEGYTGFNLAAGSVGGGTNFGSFTRYSVTGGGTFLASNSPNQTIDGAKSLGAWAGSGSGVSFRRQITTAQQFGTLVVSARFNVDNTKGFCGFNLKSTAGSGASGFGSGELVSFGTSPSAGNNGILVTDASGQRVLDLGAPVTNTILDFQVDFDALNRRYVVGAKFRTNSSFTKMGGTMSGTGTNVTHIGFANWNTGNGQDLLFDSLEVRGSSPMGIGTSPVTVSNGVSGLANNTVYNYRVAAANLDGGTSYGVNTAFYTGTDLAITSSVTGSPWIRGAAGQITLTISNAGSAASSGALTVTANLPAGLTATSMSGVGWTTNASATNCTRSDGLGSGSNHPVITLNVAVATNAAAALQPIFTISGGGDGYASNNTVTSTVTTISPAESWRTQYFGTTNNSGIGADTNAPAGDGIANLVKYALGMNPTVPATNGLPEVKITNNKLSLTFNRQKSATDIVYEVQAAGDLFGFSNNPTVLWSSASNAYGGGTNPSQSVTVQDTVGTGSTNRRFMRLQISRP